MARGVAGYGRYDSDKTHVGCPWAKSDMTPCVARDGHLAITTTRPQCVGCGNYLTFLIRDLADDWPPARGYEPTWNPAEDADLFRRLVWEATKPQGEEGNDERDGQPPAAPGT